MGSLLPNFSATNSMHDFTEGKTGAKNSCVRVRRCAVQCAVMRCDVVQCGVMAEGFRGWP